jgi:hypothetical protein
MKALFGTIIVGGSGKLGGHVITKNRAGYALRTKVTPSNPQSADQSEVRNRLTGISQSWAGLTDAQRSQWNSAVSSFSSTNIFGNVVNPSGFNLFQKLNNNLLAVGSASILVPPAPAAVQALTTLSAVADNSSNSLTLTFAPAIDAGTKFKVLATPAENAGISFVKNEFRVIGHIDSAATSPYIASALYNAKFGAIGAAGKKIYVQLVGVNATTGQMGQPIQLVCTIQA